MIYYKDFNITKAEALKALYDYSAPLVAEQDKEMSLEKAQKYLDKTNVFNFILNKAIKTTFGETGFNEIYYDCVNGIFSAKKAIQQYLISREKKDIKTL